MSFRPPRKYDPWWLQPVKVFVALFDKQIVDVRGRCHRRIRQHTLNPRWRDLPGQLKSRFMDQ